MSLFDKLFKKSHSYSHFIDDLAMRLNNETAKWIQGCIPLFVHGTPIKNTLQLQFMITAFQVVHVLSFIDMKQYVREKIGVFSNDLCDRCCGDDYAEIRPYIEKYTSLKQRMPFPEQLMELSESIADELRVSRLTVPKIDASVLLLYERSIFFAAHFFGDKKTWEPLFVKLSKA